MPEKHREQRTPSPQRKRVQNDATTTAVIKQAQEAPIDIDKEYWDLLQGMKPRHRRFVEEYLIDFNQAQAIIRAGYRVTSIPSASVAGHRLLKRDNIARAVAIGQEAYARRSIITKERIEAELAALAFSNMQDFIQVNDRGEPVINLSMLTRDNAAALSEVSVVKGRKGRKTVRIKLYDKRAALESLLKSKGYVKDESSTPREFTFHVTYDELPKGAVVDGDFTEIPSST